MIKKDVHLEGAASQGALRQANAGGKTPKGAGTPSSESDSTNSTPDNKVENKAANDAVSEKNTM